MNRTLLGQAPYDFGAVKEAYPLLEVIERVGVKLRRAGPSTFQGLCPFHEERTPSFTVYAEQQRFMCFGCKVKGDVLDFVQLHEHLASVAEACVWLTGTPRPHHGRNTKAARSGHADATRELLDGTTGE